MGIYIIELDKESLSELRARLWAFKISSNKDFKIKSYLGLRGTIIDQLYKAGISATIDTHVSESGLVTYTIRKDKGQ